MLPRSELVLKLINESISKKLNIVGVGTIDIIKDFDLKSYPHFIVGQYEGKNFIVSQTDDYHVYFSIRDPESQREISRDWLTLSKEFNLIPREYEWEMELDHYQILVGLTGHKFKYNVVKPSKIISKLEAEEFKIKAEAERADRQKKAEEARSQQDKAIRDRIETIPVKYKQSKLATVRRSMREGRYKTKSQFGEGSKVLFHGSGSPQSKLRPSMFLRNFDGGGGYGEKYWGISVTDNAKAAEAFSGSNPQGTYIHKLELAKDAVVLDMEGMWDDAVEVDETNIIDLWNRGIDVVYIGGGEGEYLVLNHSAIKVVDREWKGFR